jgi:superfamily II DNA or RNA helicase
LPPSLTTIQEELLYTGYRFHSHTSTGPLFLRSESPALLLDTELYDKTLETYHYYAYTSLQNRLMHVHAGLLRFLVDSIEDLQDVHQYVGGEANEAAVAYGGQDRTEHHLDPSPPEFLFVQRFEETFGAQALHALKAEQLYVDWNGQTRYIDFVLSTNKHTIAIEINGEQYHHPLAIGKARYRSQLSKQNSLVMDQYLVFRWSQRGMNDPIKFAEQLRSYLGDKSTFKSIPSHRIRRRVAFSLFEHQAEALESLRRQRAEGKEAFLIVLPTGLGKTEIFLEDLATEVARGKVRRALAVTPTRELQQQIVNRTKARLTQIKVSTSRDDSAAQLIVLTNAGILRYFKTLPQDYFDYILIDEAHHAAAHGLRKVLEHFTPSTLLGLTATHERLDRRRLEDIFGSYEVSFSLEEAIQRNLAPQIRAYRLYSNIDLSEVRFNGTDYVKTDLNRTVLVPSRDQLIVDVLIKYFKSPLGEGQTPKQGIVFCVDVKHTERMAQLLTAHGLPAAAVHGKQRKALELYFNQDIQFLCACQLLNEGWDAPQTSIVVMARPTMSKVLYTQQLGRGTRRAEGKEALYVIDVVDSYGALLQPWSAHNLFCLDSYQPFGDLFETQTPTPQNEIATLDGLWEEVRRIEPINIFNFEREFGELLNEEQLARELFVSTGTVASWRKKQEITPARSLPFGTKQLYYYDPAQLPIIREEKGLKQRDESTRYTDFWEFIEEGTYTFLYKIPFMLAFIQLCDEQGEAALREVVELYQAFYRRLLEKHGRVDRDGCPLNEKERLEDAQYLSRSILQNPFEKFERKRFMYQCKDLNILSFDPVLWDRMDASDLSKLQQRLIQDGITYLEGKGIRAAEADFDMTA